MKVEAGPIRIVIDSAPPNVRVEDNAIPNDPQSRCGVYIRSGLAIFGRDRLQVEMWLRRLADEVFDAPLVDPLPDGDRDEQAVRT